MQHSNLSCGRETEYTSVSFKCVGRYTRNGTYWSVCVCVCVFVFVIVFILFFFSGNCREFFTSARWAWPSAKGALWILTGRPAAASGNASLSEPTVCRVRAAPSFANSYGGPRRPEERIAAAGRRPAYRRTVCFQSRGPFLRREKKINVQKLSAIAFVFSGKWDPDGT